MEARKLVGWNVRKLRVERGVTIEHLAGEAEIGASYLAQLERGEVNVGIVILGRLAQALGAELSDLTVEPAAGSRPPKPLSAGRRPNSKRTAKR
jgi:transcriptional regulator with XRE-family HTH domain